MGEKMIKYLFGLLCLLSMGFPLQAIEVNPINKEYEMIVITHEPGEKIYATYYVYNDKTKQVDIFLLPEIHFARQETVTFLNAPPGEYSLSTSGSTIMKVIRERSVDPQPDPDDDKPPIPDPGPEPEPEPDPEPEPSDTLLATHIVIVEEANDRFDPTKLKTTNLITDTQFWYSLADRGLKYYLMDKDTETAKPYAKLLGDKIPGMVLLDEEGNYLLFSLPETKGEVQKILERSVVR